MPTLMLRRLPPELLARIRAYAKAHDLRTPDAAVRLLTAGLDHLAARSAGGVAATARLTRGERQSSGRRAVLSRWYPLRALVRAAADRPDAPPAATWMAEYLTDATLARLRPEDLARIDAYAGGAGDLQTLLAAVLPLARAHWYETAITAQHGTRMRLGYLAVPAEGGIALGVVASAGGAGKMVGPWGPVVVTPTGMDRPAGLPDLAWREVRAGAGITIRALLLGL